MDSMKDTERLKKAYEGLENVTLLYNKSRKEIENVLATNNDKVVMCLGHGSRHGLFSHNWRGFVIDQNNAHLLKDRLVIGIWCYASEFADSVGLHGYFTSMFISNYSEALFNGFPNNNEQDIFDEIDVFAGQINSFVKNDIDMSCWVGILQENCHKEKDFVRFNYEAMTFFD